MGWMDRWDLILVLVAVYVAVMALVRMMARRRDELVTDVRRQLDEQRQKSKKSARKGKGRDAA